MVSTGVGGAQARPLMFDGRWVGAYGIARYAHEVRERLDDSVVDIGVGDRANPIHLSGMASWEARTRAAQHRCPDAVLLSPGFTPSRSWGARQAITVHDLIHLDVEEEGSRAKRLYYDRVVRPAVRRHPVTFTVSQFSRRRIVEWAGVAPERVVVTGNAAGPAFTPEGRAHSPGYPYVFYLRNAKPHKNSVRLVEAFARLAHPDLRLVLSGRRDEGTSRAAEAAGVSARVIYTDSIPENDLPAFNRGAAVVAFPSLYEGFGIPAVEAMACGAPLVASDVTSLPEVVGDAAVSVDPRDVDSLTEGLDRVLTDEALRARLRVDGPRQAATFSWDAITNIVTTALREI